MRALTSPRRAAGITAAAVLAVLSPASLAACGPAGQGATATSSTAGPGTWPTTAPATSPGTGAPPAATAPTGPAQATSVPATSAGPGDWYQPPQPEDMPDDGSVRVVDPGTTHPPVHGFAKGASAQFVAAGGTVSCQMTAASVECTFPPGFVTAHTDLPDATAYCTSSTLLSGAHLGRRGNAYRCGGPADLGAVPGTPDTAWAGRSPATVTTPGGPRVVLADEHGVQVGSFECVARSGGVACAAPSIGSGFTLTPGAISFYGTAPGNHSQYE